MKQFTQRLAFIHWATLIAFFATYLLGSTLDDTQQAGAKLALYPYHFVLGGGVLLLTLVRCLFRFMDGAPAPVEGARTAVARAAKLVHGLLYGLLIVLPVSGLVMILQTGVFAAWVTRDPARLPELEKSALHGVHGSIATILMATIGLHFAAALYHQFVIKDRLMRRISLRRDPE